ncbi:MAG: hypothetical protein ABFR97_10835, partial [Thermodesulfobacteriota bacterium]
IRGCEITNNGNGIFLRGDDNGDESTITRNTLVAGNYIHGNGNIGSETQHNIYSQGVSPIFQYNRIGRQRPGAGGISLKDRSANTVIRYNWIESGARTIDLVEAEDASIVVAEGEYGNAYVYGNIIINEIDDTDGYAWAGHIVHFGADNFADDGTGDCTAPDPDICRNGTLYFHNNTVIIKDYRTIAQDSPWVQDRLFELSVRDATADIRNNLFHLHAPNGHPNLTLMRQHGTANLNGVNWITANWAEHALEDDYHQWTGTINYNGTLIEGSAPELAAITSISGNLTGDDYRPSASSPLIDQATPLPPTLISAGHGVNQEYERHQAGVNRNLTGAAPDLGALEYR